MGYSCTRAADYTRARVEAAMTGVDCNNSWSKDGVEYFWDCDTEKPDGRITGVVYQMFDDDVAYPVGSILIYPGGTLERWPCATQAMLMAALDHVNDDPVTQGLVLQLLEMTK